MKKRKSKYVDLPMEFNPGLSKFEPELPIRKKQINVKKKRNLWALWYIIILILILALTLYFACQ
jgi:hypothetical protein